MASRVVNDFLSLFQATLSSGCWTSSNMFVDLLDFLQLLLGAEPVILQMNLPCRQAIVARFAPLIKSVMLPAMFSQITLQSGQWSLACCQVLHRVQQLMIMLPGFLKLRLKGLRPRTNTFPVSKHLINESTTTWVLVLFMHVKNNVLIASPLQPQVTSHGSSVASSRGLLP